MYMKRKSKLLDVAKKMPALRHSVPGETFDIRKSEVVKWLLDQPDIMNYLWNHVKQSGYVEYDSETGLWKGVPDDCD